VEGLEYSDRACCEIGSNFPSETCGLPNDGIDTIETMSIPFFVALSVAGLCIVFCCGAVTWKCYKQVIPQATKKVTVISLPSAPAPAPVPVAAIPSINTLPVASAVPSPSSYVIPGSNGNAQVAHGGVNSMISPSAPPMNPTFHVRR